MSKQWTDARRQSLCAFSDTVFPAVDMQPDPHGFWARTASAIGADRAAAALLDCGVPEPARSGLLGLLDAFAAAGIATADPPAREAIIHAVAASSPQACAGVVALQKIVLNFCYALTDASGRNPNWTALGYPGPLRAPPAVPKPIRPIEIERDGAVLEADVCVVGSGAGGGVIAGELARRGLHVLVLEAGGYFNEADFNHLELWSFQNLYWRGGYNPTADGSVQLVAGSTLGGGTQVNWENCVPTPAWVREQWAREHGLDGVDGPAFDHHLDAVLARLSVNDRCSDLNGPHQRLADGARKLGYAFRRTMRNVDPAKYDPETAGFHGFGDITGSRQSTVNTYLADAQSRGAQIAVRTRAERIVVEAGRASGVEATCAGADGTRRRVRVRARHVVAACGALETPALLLRSGIGGPAAGKYLRLHPCVALAGVYAENQKAWWGPPQSALCDQFLRCTDDHGFLIEGAHHTLGVSAASIPWRSGQEHKSLMSLAPRCAPFIAIVRDHGHGSVGIDASGASMPVYPITDALDLEHLRRGLRELARLQEAAGAERILCFAAGRMRVWERGKDLTAFLQAIESAPFGGAGHIVFSAHQMGSARMGKDPETSAAQPSGELHDVRNVWIGDTSAFPTPPGVNPMITCMALAARTAEHIAA